MSGGWDCFYTIHVRIVFFFFYCCAHFIRAFFATRLPIFALTNSFYHFALFPAMYLAELFFFLFALLFCLLLCVFKHVECRCVREMSEEQAPEEEGRKKTDRKDVVLTAIRVFRRMATFLWHTPLPSDRAYSLHYIKIHSTANADAQQEKNKRAVLTLSLPAIYYLIISVQIATISVTINFLLNDKKKYKSNNNSNSDGDIVGKIYKSRINVRCDEKHFTSIVLIRFHHSYC